MQTTSSPKRFYVDIFKSGEGEILVSWKHKTDLETVETVQRVHLNEIFVYRFIDF